MIALDDNIEDHPKFVGLSNDAFALWVRCIGYCRRNLTDGFVPEQAAVARARTKTPKKAIAELLKPAVCPPGLRPLWVRVETGFLVCNYLKWNPSRARVEEDRAANRWSRAAYPIVSRRDGLACRYCGADNDLTIDHLVPRSLGGGDEPENLAVACRSCNARKGARTPEQAGMVLLRRLDS